jgi:hypothetical protein
MKTSNINPRNLRKLVTLTCVVFTASFLLSMTISNEKTFKFLLSKGYALPDTLPPDTLNVTDTISVTGFINVSDTTEILTISLDSIFLLSEDTTVYIAQYDSTVSYYIGDSVESVLFEKQIDSVAYYYVTDTAAYYIPGDETAAYKIIQADTVLNFGQNQYSEENKIDLKILSLSNDISIRLGNDPKPINTGIFGMNWADEFKNSSLPILYKDATGTLVEEPTSQAQWDWVAALTPEVVRIPSGSYSKFVHFLPYKDSDADGELDPVVGLGYDIIEIARFFDETDGVLNLAEETAADIAAGVTGITNEMDEILSESDGNLNDWILNDDKILDHYKNYVKKYNAQLTEDTRYIDDIIYAVHKIEDANDGKKVKVIVCLNILSETASQCHAIIQYLIDHNIVVSGVEMGNECYASYYCKSMGFSSFNNYYNYINGGTTPVTDDLFEFYDGWELPVKYDHDYIGAFRGINQIEGVEIGVVGASDEEAYIGNDDACANKAEWNLQCRSHYGDNVAYFPHQYKFDAVIIHNYYATNDWGDYLTGSLYFNPILECNTDAEGYDARWHFDGFDPRLQPSFIPLRKLFKDYLSTGYYDQMNTLIAGLEFWLPEEVNLKKDLWYTEWNLKTNPSGNATPLELNEYKIMSNNFLDGVYTFEQVLDLIKINYMSVDGIPYRENFLTYACIHNLAGGVWEDLLTIASDAELDNLGITCAACDLPDTDPNSRNYYLRRTNYFVFMLLSNIFKNNLQYLPSTFSYASKHVNIKPTVFIDQDKENIYLFYSNMTDQPQNYKIDPAALLPFYFEAIGIEFGSVYGEYIYASQLYSTSGRNTLYNWRDNTWTIANDTDGDGLYDLSEDPDGVDERINICYEDNPPVPLIEINGISNFFNYPDCSGHFVTNGCITVNPYSIGYVKLSIVPIFPEERNAGSNNEKVYSLSIYPNPAGNYITLHDANTSVNTAGYKVNIRNSMGVTLIIEQMENDGQLNISSLIPGIYFVTTTTPDGKTINTSFIKI